jgi:hypothetical protein
MKFTLYDRTSGTFLPGHYFCSSDADVALHETPDLAAIEGHHDHRSKRVDPAIGAVVDYTPPPPSAEVVANERRRAALARIVFLEAKSLRAMRESIIDPIGGLQRTKAINDEIDALRADL